jgi:single-strand DNA-binding protein
MIKLMVIGNLGKDAFVNDVNGKKVINFTVAHTEKYKDAQGTQQEKTTWVDCAKWGDNTAVAPFLTKGKQVYVEGTPEVRTFTRQDGTSGATLACRVSNIQLLGGSSQGAAAAATPAASSSGNASAVTEPIDDLPF